MKQPEKKFSAGSIQISVWRNQVKTKGKEGEYKTVSFGRAYKDKETGEWKTTASLRIGDIPKAIAALSKTYEYLIVREGVGIIEEDIVV